MGLCSGPLLVPMEGGSGARSLPQITQKQSAALEKGAWGLESSGHHARLQLAVSDTVHETLLTLVRTSAHMHFVLML